MEGMEATPGMIVAHLRRRISERTNKPILEGSTDYELPKGSILVLKKCDKHDECYQLWAVVKLAPGQEKVQTTFF